MFEAERQARGVPAEQALAASLSRDQNEVLTILVEDDAVVASAWAAVLDRGARAARGGLARIRPAADRSLPVAVPRSSPPGNRRGPGATRDLPVPTRWRASTPRIQGSSGRWKSMVAGSRACRCSIRSTPRSVSCRCNCLRAGRSPGVGVRAPSDRRARRPGARTRRAMSWSTRWRPPSRRACSRVRFRRTRVSVATRYRRAPRTSTRAAIGR